MYPTVFFSMASGHFILLDVSPIEPAVFMSMLLECRHLQSHASDSLGSNDEVALQVSHIDDSLWNGLSKLERCTWFECCVCSD